MGLKEVGPAPWDVHPAPEDGVHRRRPGLLCAAPLGPEDGSAPQTQGVALGCYARPRLGPEDGVHGRRREGLKTVATMIRHK